MKNIKFNVSNILSWTSVVLTVAVLLITGLSQLSIFKESFKQESLDVLIFGLIWIYILGLPIACGFALMVGDRSHPLVRSNFVSLAIWILFIVWTFTVTL
jgi:hypothetical protein